MLLDRQDAQVFQPVVSAVSVDVIDLLPSFEAAPKCLLDHVSVFQDSLAIDSDPDVSPGRVNALGGAVATLSAVAFGDLAAGWYAERGAALVASLHEAGSVVGGLAANGGEARSLDGRDTGEPQAPSRAKTDVVFLDAIGANREGGAADDADHRDTHE